MFNPVATYRIQFHKGFTFTDLQGIIPYLQKLGVSTLYASPIFEAVPGSTHGYDIVDPHRINPEIGTLKQLRAISKQLKDTGISWLQDIVPNHMAYHPGNHWLMDVFEKGTQSAYTGFFDMAGNSEFFSGQVMVPFLGEPLDEVIRKGELTIAYVNGKLVFKYFDSTYPLKIESYPAILKTTKNESLKQWLKQISRLQKAMDGSVYSKQADALLQQLKLLLKNKSVKQDLALCLLEVNGHERKLKQLAAEQYYRLCSWTETDDAINFRRFFTVNGLICLNMQGKAVFDHYHRFIKSLLQEGLFDGLRVDHIDGLYDPAAYLARLRELAGPDTYIVVEKILEQGEEMAAAWPIQGTTGYEFLAEVNNLFTDRGSEKSFTKFYNTIITDKQPVQQQIWEKKAFILHQHMAGELDNLCRYFFDLGLAEKNELQGLPFGAVKNAIGAFLIHCPVYRYYGNSFPLTQKEMEALYAVFKIVKANIDGSVSAIELLETVLLKKPDEGNHTFNKNLSKFYRRCMQLSGPLMAKGVEDTLMYTYNRFAGHNEVGDAPDVFGQTVKDFHRQMQLRQQQWPLSLNATSTHDTKRGEDVRARLNVLTGLGEEWLEKVKTWREMNAGSKQDNAPDANDEYLIYQTITGAYPMPGEGEDNFNKRLTEYLEKALREAKRHSDWAKPNEVYEKGVKDFVVVLLDKAGAFWESFVPFHQKVSDLGIVNSLAQVLLKLTSPGTPDVYQGCERWDLSLVDPDNRRPVDHEACMQLLNDIAAGDSPSMSISWQERYNAKIKIALTQQLLHERKLNPVFFARADYIPLKVKGAYRKNVLAFARRYRREWYVVALPLHIGALCDLQEAEITGIDWKDTRILLPENAPGQFEDLLAKTTGQTGEQLWLKDIFSGFPLAMIKLTQPENDRGAGILMHITSLPSAFGIGDIGPEAKLFADFLYSSGQKYWQVLPVTPTDEANGYSPYSSFSSMAGNILLISPEKLVLEDLLDQEDLDQIKVPTASKVDYKKAVLIKQALFDKAWQRTNVSGSIRSEQDFLTFCRQEAYWLDDYAMFVELKQRFGGEPWHKWPEKYRLRDPDALKRFCSKHADDVDKHKWLQFQFARQWRELKEYCRDLQVELFGDLPFYVSYDSVDVWANPELFSLDVNGSMKDVAGVPPDYFNADGQLWGMPVFCWDAHARNHYQWWVDRIRKNMELFSLLRLDHFRAFAAYWEVPASDTTAINGKWRPGPGSDLFNVLEQQLGKLPFVAEDLGDIDAPVYALRDEFNLPGMKVLQFAFGDTMPASPYIPHNFKANCVVYTGTHDNNTTHGWFRRELDKTRKKQLSSYVGYRVNRHNVHEVLRSLAYASVARIVIAPAQDILGLGETHRMNNPGSVTGNWLWRVPAGAMATHRKTLYDQVTRFNRL